jgi:hypothetical protein
VNPAELGEEIAVELESQFESSLSDYLESIDAE